MGEEEAVRKEVLKKDTEGEGLAAKSFQKDLTSLADLIYAKEGLIVAQGEPWQRASPMQAERRRLGNRSAERRTAE